MRLSGYCELYIKYETCSLNIGLEVRIDTSLDCNLRGNCTVTVGGLQSIPWDL